MADARAPFRATMPVQIGPCRGGDFIARSEGPAKRVARGRYLVELASSVRFSSWAETPGFWVYSVVSVGRCGRLSWKQQTCVLKACSQATQWLRESVRTMVCGANLASHVHALVPFCSCCCDGVLPMPKQGEWSSWLRHPRHFCHHGMVWSMVFSESLEMARLRPLTQQSLERGWCPSVSGRARSTSQLWR